MGEPIQIPLAVQEILKKARSVKILTERLLSYPIEDDPAEPYTGNHLPHIGQYVCKVPSISIILDNADIRTAGEPIDLHIKRSFKKTSDEDLDSIELSTRSRLERYSNTLYHSLNQGRFLASISEGRVHVDVDGFHHDDYYLTDENRNDHFRISLTPNIRKECRPSGEFFYQRFDTKISWDDYKKNFLAIAESWVAFHEQHVQQEREQLQEGQPDQRRPPRRR